MGPLPHGRNPWLINGGDPTYDTWDDPPSMRYHPSNPEIGQEFVTAEISREGLALDDIAASSRLKPRLESY